MELAEALGIRADLHNRINQLRSRLKPAKIVSELYKELDECLSQIEEIIYQINSTEIIENIENQFLASGTCGAQGDNLTWTLTTDGVLTISGKGDMKDYPDGDAPWSDYQNDIKEVVLLNDVTSIGNYALGYCTCLTSVTIPPSVTSIGEKAFYYCSSLTSIFIPEGVESIGAEAWAFCFALASITISKGVRSMGEHVFMNSDNLFSIVVATDNPYYSSQDGVLFNKDKTELLHYPASKLGETYGIPDGVKRIGDSAFHDCVNLTSIVIPKGVTDIGEHAFYSCESLTSIVIPEGVTSIGEWAFSQCNSLTLIVIPEGVSSIGDNTFDGCGGLKNIVIPEGVSSIGRRTFCNCSSLKNIVIPKGVSSIGDQAFGGCIDLEELIIRAEVPPAIDITDLSPFLGVDKSIPVYVPAESIEAYRVAEGWNMFTNFLPIEEREEGDER